MGNKVSNYLERFRDYCGKRLSNSDFYSLYGAYGSFSHLTEEKNFCLSFIFNKVFIESSELHKIVYSPCDSSDTTKLLVDIINGVQEYIKSFKNQIYNITHSYDFPEDIRSLIDDAVQLIAIFRHHFTLHFENLFTGEYYSIFESRPSDSYNLAVWPLTDFLIHPSIIEARINGELPNEIGFTRIIGYCCTLNGFLEYICGCYGTHREYTGIIYFTSSAIKHLEQCTKRTSVNHKVKYEDGYYYIEFEYDYDTSNKSVFHIEENGELFKLVAFRTEKYNLNGVKRGIFGHCSDEKFIEYLADTGSELSEVGYHIDFFK